jgi:hypothetical protein
MTDNTRDMLYKNMLGVRETIEAYALQILSGDYGGADEPTVEGTPISKYPLEVVDERGREFAIVLRSQPTARHIAVAADDGHDARLEGYWAGEHVTLHSDTGALNTFLDYFVER